MKYLRKFATEAEIADVERPGVAWANDTNVVKYYPKVPYGVYVQHIDGTLYTKDGWQTNQFASEEANGVAVHQEMASFVIAKTHPTSPLLSYNQIRWGGYKIEITDIVTTTSPSEAMADYDGRGNTLKIIAQLSGVNDSYHTGAPAAETCEAYIFPDGSKGYLPAFGEWYIASRHFETINDIMSLIGGDALVKENYWSSTQIDSQSIWCLYWGTSGTANSYIKASYHYLRAFAPLNL